MVVYAQKKRYIKMSGGAHPLGSPHASCNMRILSQIKSREGTTQETNGLH